MSVKLFVQHSHSICTAGKIEYKASTLPELNHYGKRHILGQSVGEHVCAELRLRLESYHR